MKEKRRVQYKSSAGCSTVRVHRRMSEAGGLSNGGKDAVPLSLPLSMYKYPHFLSLSFLAFGIPYNDTKAGGKDLYGMRFRHSIVIRAQVDFDKRPFNLHLDLSSSCFSPPFPSNDVKWKETRRRRKEKKESGYKMKEVRRGGTW